jgi:predicted Fe-Mo cluster-binding NifX family protein
MKIAVSSKGAGLGAWMEPQLSQCGFLMIVDETGDFLTVENPGSPQPEENELALAQAAIDQQVGAFITGFVGKAALDLLKKKGIQVYAAQSGSILELIDLLADGELMPLV